MSFGAQVLVRIGDSNLFTPLVHELACAITEIRVEQHLDKQTTFAIRFQEDFAQSQAQTACNRKFKETTGLAIVVPSHDISTNPDTPTLVCLVRGQVEKVNFDVDTGAAGSVFEVLGKDVRTIADRTCKANKFKGPSSEILRELVTLFSTQPAVIGPDAITYLPSRKTFNFRGTALEGIQELAKKSDFSFWLVYPIKQVPVISGDSKTPPETIYEIDVVAHLEPSPPRPQDHDSDESKKGKKGKKPKKSSKKPANELEAANLDNLEITAELRVLPVADECETVVNFKIDVDNEATEQSSAAAIEDDAKGETKRTGGQTSTFTSLSPGGETVADVGTEPSAGPPEDQPAKSKKSKKAPKPLTNVRSLCVGVPGDADVNDNLSKAAVNQAAWFVKGEALTTVFKLGKVVEPHQIVRVSAGGCGVNGIYQISDVTHVINAAEHWMSLNLRTNARETGDE